MKSKGHFDSDHTFYIQRSFIVFNAGYAESESEIMGQYLQLSLVVSEIENWKIIFSIYNYITAAAEWIQNICQWSKFWMIFINKTTLWNIHTTVASYKMLLTNDSIYNILFKYEKDKQTLSYPRQGFTKLTGSPVGKWENWKRQQLSVRSHKFSIKFQQCAIFFAWKKLFDNCVYRLEFYWLIYHYWNIVDLIWYKLTNSQILSSKENFSFIDYKPDMDQLKCNINSTKKEINDFKL